MTSELLTKIVLLKQKVADAKTAPVLQKPARIEAAIEEAIFIIEDMVNEQVRLEQLLDDYVTNGLGLGEQVHGD